MNKEELILKWLDHSITKDELAMLQKHPEFEDYKKISDTASLFEAPTFDQDELFEKIKLKHSRKKPNIFWVYGLAASLLLLFGILFYTSQSNTNSIQTEIAQKTEVILPDTSIVLLNANSRIQYNDEKWEDERRIQLDGEAYFKVAKGKIFDVLTNQGMVSVLGTEFVVKDRVGYYQIDTFEGLVQVKTKDTTVLVAAGNSVRFENGNFRPNLLSNTQPSWSEGISTFKSVTLKEVLDELERQYDIELNRNNLPESKLFTGSFPHNNIEQALQSIATPLKLTYSIRSEKAVSLEYIEE